MSSRQVDQAAETEEIMYGKIMVGTCSRIHRFPTGVKTSLLVHKKENFIGSDFDICTFL